MTTTAKKTAKAPAKKATASKTKTAATKAPTSVEVVFDFERETPGTYRFKEQGEKDTHAIGTLYVKKSALGAKAPSTITVTINL